MTHIFLVVVLLFGTFAPSLSVAQTRSVAEPAAADIEQRRALFNYQMFCQGCHAIDGAGHKSVPELKGFMHKFMGSQQGREYLIRVPGAANSVLDDVQLTELMNWMLREFGSQDKTSSWEPYEVEEVSEYRKNPLNETIEYRQRLIAGLKLESEL